MKTSLQILGQTKKTVKQNYMLKAQLPLLLVEKEKEQQVIWQCTISESQLVRYGTALAIPKPLNYEYLTTDSKSDKEDSEEESHVESTTTSTNCRKRKRTAGNLAVYNFRITITCASSYSGTPLFQTHKLWTPPFNRRFAQVQIVCIFPLTAVHYNP